ncbi:MAG TPA: YHS domain-containing (seleno)protein [Gammaproteobacteria bacterium]|nr:YHS domain-containing (seleno)protein [Gammaproteobacteria bacterium]
MNHFRTFASVFVALFALLGTSVAMAAAETNVSSGLTIKGSPLAVHGYDVVAYFTQGQPTIGRAKFSTEYKDATYRFASSEHLKAFEKNPEKYVPQYGGYCAYGVAVGAKFDGDPLLWKIVDGKLYLNLNEDIQATWEKDIPENITKANRNWTKIASKTPKELS